MNPLLNRLYKNALDRPETVFCIVVKANDERPITWGELLRRSRVFAAMYVAQGVKRGDIVYIILRHEADLYASFIGAMLIGAIPSFLPFPNHKQDASLYSSSHRDLFLRSNARLILCLEGLEADLSAAVGGSKTRIVSVREAEYFGTHNGDIDRYLGVCTLSHSEIALLQHSSGTTGLKKGVMLSYGAIVRQLDAYLQALACDSAEPLRVASWLPLYHDMGLITGFLLPMYAGGLVIAMDAFEWVVEPTQILDIIEAHRATHCWLPNFAFRHIVRSSASGKRWDLSCIRAFISCSEPRKPDVFADFIARFGNDGIGRDQLSTCYAMAEAVFAVTQTDAGVAPIRLWVDPIAFSNDRIILSEHDNLGAMELLSSGKPIKGVELTIFREGNPVKDRVISELAVRADFLFSGYFGDSDATTEVISDDGWYLTGDLGFRENGKIFVTGRVKDIIIINGRNFYAHDIEAIANATDGINPAGRLHWASTIPR